MGDLSSLREVIETCKVGVRVRVAASEGIFFGAIKEIVRNDQGLIDEIFITEILTPEMRIPLHSSVTEIKKLGDAMTQEEFTRSVEKILVHDNITVPVAQPVFPPYQIPVLEGLENVPALTRNKILTLSQDFKKSNYQ